MKLHRNKKIAFYALPIFLVFVLCCSHTIAPIDYNPTEGWRMSTPEEQGMHSKHLLEMMQCIEKNEYNIQSVSIVRNGYLVLDSYIYPFKDGQSHRMYSVTKSVTSALIGIAIDKGFIQNVNQTIVELFPNRKILNLDDQKRSMTLKNLLMMTSGLKCNDGWEKNWAGLFEMMKSDDWTQYTLNLPMEKAPGEWFDYCNGVSHLLSAIINETTGMRTVDFASKYLFNPLGISDVKWETSPEGINLGYMRLWLQPKDMAKIGLLYLNKGKWGDKQIISSNWVEASTQPYHETRLGNDKYGYQWWVNPAGFYLARGIYGQFIYVVPDKNLVAVFTGNIEGKKMNISGSLLKDYIGPSIASLEPLPPNPEITANLNAMVEKLAKGSTEGMTWISENDGVAKNGIFKRTTEPSFTFEYPLGSTKAELTAPRHVMRMKTPENVAFDASVVSIPEGMKLADFGAQYYTNLLQHVGSNIEVLSNKEITLKCGTKAYRTDIKWLWNGTFPISTVLISAYKNGQCVYLATHPLKNPEKVANIVQSLSLK